MARSNYELCAVAFEHYKERYYSNPVSAKKKAEFSKLLRRAIHNELSEVDAEILNMYFFKGFTTREIAEVYGITHSSVSRRINKSLDTLYEKLKYAAEYRFGIVIEKRC